MGTIISIEIEPLDEAIGELGRRYRALEITRHRRDSRLSELRSNRPELRRSRSRRLIAALPKPVTFYSLEEVPSTATEALCV
jgi:hypothetical protein